jgi:tripartite-type tricarboxylate transporter receptor subunit TctC
VPYKGAGPAIIDTVAGHVDLIIASVAILLPQIEAGKLKPLMQTGKTRLEVLRTVPTAIESGFADFEALAWWGIFAPKGTPEAIVRRANAAFTQTLGDETAKRQLIDTQQINLTLDGPEAFRTFFARQIQTWGDVVRENGIKASN